MAKKQSKPFTEADLEKMGLKETAPNFYEKAIYDSLKRIKNSKTVSFGMGGFFKQMIPYDSTPPSTDIFYFIGEKYKFKPKLFIAVPPCSAPRMTRRDAIFIDPDHADPKKRQRTPVTKYFAFKTAFKNEADRMNVKLTEVLNICFIVPMPQSWSKNKRDKMRYEPHKQRPDRDNYLKAVQDAFGGDDGFVWDGRTLKIWGETGGMIIF